MARDWFECGRGGWRLIRVGRGGKRRVRRYGRGDAARRRALALLVRLAARLAARGTAVGCVLRFGQATLADGRAGRPFPSVWQRDAGDRASVRVTKRTRPD